MLPWKCLGGLRLKEEEKRGNKVEFSNLKKWGTIGRIIGSVKNSENFIVGFLYHLVITKKIS